MRYIGLDSTQMEFVMVDNHAARASEQPPKVGAKRGWISKVIVAAAFIGLIAALVILT